MSTKAGNKCVEHVNSSSKKSLLINIFLFSNARQWKIKQMPVALLQTVLLAQSLLSCLQLFNRVCKLLCLTLIKSWWWSDTYETLTANYCCWILTTIIISVGERLIESREKKMKMLRKMANIYRKPNSRVTRSIYYE